jgi:hypothetical protein
MAAEVAVVQELELPAAWALEPAAVVAAAAWEPTAGLQAGCSGPWYCRWPAVDSDSDSDSVVYYILKKRLLELS